MKKARVSVTINLKVPETFTEEKLKDFIQDCVSKGIELQGHIGEEHTIVESVKIYTPEEVKRDTFYGILSKLNRKGKVYTVSGLTDHLNSLLSVKYSEPITYEVIKTDDRTTILKILNKYLAWEPRAHKQWYEVEPYTPEITFKKV